MAQRSICDDAASGRNQHKGQRNKSAEHNGAKFTCEAPKRTFGVTGETAGTPCTYISLQPCGVAFAPAQVKTDVGICSRQGAVGIRTAAMRPSKTSSPAARHDGQTRRGRRRCFCACRQTSVLVRLQEQDEPPRTWITCALAKRHSARHLFGLAPSVMAHVDVNSARHRAPGPLPAHVNVGHKLWLLG